ncbi:MAG: MoxR family ATPase [Proteobacteria bacterium]|nr:MoxR family ATPase [Pseudomonadota bacterium]
MDIAFKCPLCEQEFRVEAALAGTEFRCPTCLKVSQLPEAPAAPPPTGPKVVSASSLPPPPPQSSAPPPVPKAAVRVAGSDNEDARLARRLTEAYQRVTAEVGKLIVGQEEVIEQLLIAIFARSHCLLEGVPGLAKTYMVKTLSDALQLSFRRVQFTPDLMPADITGTDVIQEDAATGRRNLTFLKGPLFAQMILADEINRSPPKTQAALLEAMQEHCVTVGGRTYKLDQPFFVLATQNPVEQEGTYPLPEAQKDRFMFHVRVDYPSREEEREIIKRTTSAYSADVDPVITGEEVIAIQKTVRKVPVPDHVTDFVLDLVRRARPTDAEAPAFTKELVAWGPGPRACQQLILGGKVRAVLRNRFHVTVEDIEALAAPVLRHRIVPTFNAEAEGIKVDTIIARVLKETPRHEPKKVM